MRVCDTLIPIFISAVALCFIPTLLKIVSEPAVPEKRYVARFMYLAVVLMSIVFAFALACASIFISAYPVRIALIPVLTGALLPMFDFVKNRAMRIVALSIIPLVCLQYFMGLIPENMSVNNFAFAFVLVFTITTIAIRRKHNV